MQQDVIDPGRRKGPALRALSAAPTEELPHVYEPVRSCSFAKAGQSMGVDLVPAK